ncbi:prepilin peptidase [Lactobacillus johnsonii]|uniref:prepilin peptidase n=1 Tax=Lactobacillus johnsonii TaxID=33959 RepID=UPI0022E63FB5|nr:prepilin peptidase [Lactobacillus johnsonii]
MPTLFIYGLNFIFGTIIGSHLLVIVQRFGQENFISEKSHCDSCKIPLTLLNQIPIFSFIRYKGQCFFCNAPIPIEALYCELLGGISFLPLNPYLDQSSYLFITFIFLISIFDYFDHSFPISLLFPLICIIVLTRAFLNYELIEWGLIFAIILIFLIMNLKNKFGYGDTIIFVILIFYYDFYTAQYIFLLASILLLINHILGDKRNTYPFVPFIFLSLIFYNFL